MWGVRTWSMHVSMSMQFLPPQSQNAGALPDVTALVTPCYCNSVPQELNRQFLGGTNSLRGKSQVILHKISLQKLARVRTSIQITKMR